MVRIDEKTPNGGDYSEMYYFDSNGEITEDREKAVQAVIRECKSDGTLVYETWSGRLQ